MSGRLEGHSLDTRPDVHSWVGHRELQWEGKHCKEQVRRSWVALGGQSVRTTKGEVVHI